MSLCIRTISLSLSLTVGHSVETGLCVVSIAECRFIAVQRGLIADIIARFEKRGYQLSAMKFFQPSLDLAREHYVCSFCSVTLTGPIDRTRHFEHSDQCWS